MIGASGQTSALLLDAYRELNARKLFWISLMISGVVVLAFAAVGISASGWTFLWWEFPSDFLNSRRLEPALFYKYIFANAAVPLWLAWAASILGLISTASIIPDFIAGGAVELTLSKPIARGRLILTKYLCGLLFAALQVAVFTAACFLIIGVRGGAWEPRLFLALPIVVLFFSYLYCVCAVLGLLTRSTIASLLLTILFWFLIFGVHSTESTFLMLKARNELREQKIAALTESARAKLTRAEEAIAALPASETDKRARFEDARLKAQADVAHRVQQQESNTESGVWYERGHTIAYTAKTLLPKTTETIGLLDRYLMRPEDAERLHPPNDTPALPGLDDDVKVSARAVGLRIEEKLRGRSLGWVLGTSIVFECVVLLLLVRIFARRDF